MPQLSYESPIFRAVIEGELEVIEGLMSSGWATPNVVDPFGLGLTYVSRSSSGF